MLYCEEIMEQKSLKTTWGSGEAVVLAVLLALTPQTGQMEKCMRVYPPACPHTCVGSSALIPDFLL